MSLLWINLKYHPIVYIFLNEQGVEFRNKIEGVTGLCLFQFDWSLLDSPSKQKSCTNFTVNEKKTHYK